MTVKMDRSNASQQEFSAYLKNARQHTGWTQAEMAEALDIQLAAYRRWEVGDGLPQNQARKMQVEQKVDILLQRTEAAPQEPPQPEIKHATYDGPVTEQTKKECPMPGREPSYDNRNMDEQLQDLCVERVTVPSLGKRPEEDAEPEPVPAKPKAIEKIKWYDSMRVGHGYLGHRISITKNGISFGKQARETLGGEGVYIRLGSSIRNGESVPVFEVAKTGAAGAMLLSCKKNGNTGRMGSTASMRWLKERGVKFGKYELRQIRDVDNTWVGLPVEDAV